MSNKLYLAYGSNLNREQMAMRCPTAEMFGVSVMKNYRLLFRGSKSNAVATIERARGRSVPVLVWEITPNDELALDRYEGFPFLYRKEKVRVCLDGKIITAMVYIMNGDRPLGAPSCYYYSIICAGYKDAGFDADILRTAVSDSNEGGQNE